MIQQGSVTDKQLRKTVTLDGEECSLVLTSLEYTKRNIENCTSYPSYEFKCQQIANVDRVIAKIRAMRKAAK